MKKIIISICSLLCGLFVLAIWDIGSHGNSLKFRPWMVEDWVLMLLILSSITIPAIFLVGFVRKRFPEITIMKPKTIIYLTAVGLFIGGIIYYFFPYTSIPQGVAVDKIVILKSQRKLLAYAQGLVVRTYTVSLGRNPIGAKVYEGDYKTPEGSYVINEKNPQSSFHKSLGISYPNQQDLANARQLGKPPGGDIKIHGLGNDLGFVGRFQRWKDWTTGCIALTNEEIDDLYMHTQLGTQVEIKK